MPKEIRHQTQWYSNQTFLNDLIVQNRFPDWIATVAFYTALHRIEQFLARRNEHPKNHMERKLTLDKYTNVLGQQTIYDYMDMYNTSLDARYECTIPSPADVTDQLNRLARIEAVVKATP